MKKLPFNDEWILHNHASFRSYRELAEEHNRLFGTSFSREQMKNHAGLILGVRFDNYWVTPEMKDWIRREYPKVGTAKEKAKKFNAEFGTDKAAHSITSLARYMGVSLSDEAKADYKRKSAQHISNYNATVRASPVGHVGRITNGYPFVKTSGGWVSQGRCEYMKHHGDIPKGHAVIFLDGDVNNVSESNLMAIPKRCQSLMTANKLWSEEPELTRAGALWSELYSVTIPAKRR